MATWEFLIKKLIIEIGILSFSGSDLGNEVLSQALGHLFIFGETSMEIKTQSNWEYLATYLDTDGRKKPLTCEGKPYSSL